MAGQRLSQRTAKAEPDGPYEGVPEHLRHGIVRWFERVCGHRHREATQNQGSDVGQPSPAVLLHF